MSMKSLGNYSTTLRLSRKKLPNSIILFCILTGLLVNAYFTQNYPSIRYLSVAIIFTLVLFRVATALMTQGSDSHFIISVVLLYFIIQCGLNIYREYPANLNTFIVVFIGYLIQHDCKNLMRWIVLTSILCITVMLYELIDGEYFIQINEAKFEFGRLQGLFSTSKEAGFFAIAAFILSRLLSKGKMSLDVIFILIAVLSGTRTAIIFITACMILEYSVMIASFRKKIIYKLFVSVTILLATYYLLTTYYFTNELEYMLRRILNSFNFQTSSHIQRIYFWNAYLYGIDNYSIFELVFGAGRKLNYEFGNGAESFYLMVLSQNGILGLIIIVFPFLYVFSRRINYRLMISLMMLLVFFNVGRIGVGWADGIIIWAILFNAFKSTQKLKVGDGEATYGAKAYAERKA